MTHRLVSTSLASSLACAAACAGATSSSPEDQQPTGIDPTGVGTDAGDEAGDGTDGGSGDGDEPDSGSTDACPECDDGVCIDGVCCAIDAACNDVCCDEGSVCSFGTCVVPGDTCVDASDCAAAQYCEYALGDPDEPVAPGCEGGASLQSGRCLPQPPQCAADVEPDPENLDCLPRCEFTPQSSFDPVVKYEWTGDQVMMAPIVLQLDDDNCDGHVDERDVPELVFTSFVGNQYGVNGTLRAMTVDQGALVEKWTVPPAGDAVAPGHGLAGGNIDGVPGNEIVACTEANRARAYRADGTVLWESVGLGSCDQPSIADADQDGLPEVIVERRVLDGATGAVELSLTGGGELWWTDKTIVADITGDGRLDYVKPARAWDADGLPLVTGAPPGTFPAVADFDLDGLAEVVSIRNTGQRDGIHVLQMWRYDPAAANGFATIRTNININGTLPVSHCPTTHHGYSDGGGPPTIADFNGDGFPDVGVAGGIGYAVFDGTKLVDPSIANPDTFLWIRQTQDCSSAFTGSSVFDFDGDGGAEVVYADEEMLRIYRGTDGEILWETCNTSGTLHEYPVIADVDNDGHADIVAVSNDYSYLECPVDGSKTRGVRIFGDSEGKWVRTRRVWNQHAYQVNNVEEDGTIPIVQAPNHTTPGLNNFRQNVQPELERAAPDLVARVIPRCNPSDYGVDARVRNIGEAAVEAGVVVGFYAGDPAQGGQWIASAVTTKVLYPAEAEDVALPVAPPEAIEYGEVELFVVIDDGMPQHPWHECRTDNNTAHGPAGCAIAG
jgi:hypothetical protein